MMIYEALAAAMSEVGPIGKGKVNQQQNFKYRGVDDVMNAIQPVFVKNEIFVVPEVLEQVREERKTKSGSNLIYTILKVRYTFYAKDGSNVSAIVVGEGMDSADKSCNKAMSVAFKYACFQILCIPTEEFKDPDAGSHPPSTPEPPRCEMCGAEIKGLMRNGQPLTAQQVAEKIKAKHGRLLCKACQEAMSA